MASQAGKPGRDVADWEFSIITSLPEEFRSTCQHLTSLKRESAASGVGVYRCSIPMSETRSLKGTIIQPLATGRVEAAVAATFTMLNYDPKIIAVIGIAGGFKWIEDGEKLLLGDVVFADRFIDTEYKKIFRDREEIRSREYVVSKEWIRLVEDYRDEEMWWPEHAFDRRGVSSRSARPNLHIGSVVSASSVIAKRGAQHSIHSKLRSLGQEGSVLAVEMEAVGVAVAASRLGYADKVVMFRGINDYADEDKNRDESEWRHVAMDNAAAAGIGFIKYYARANQWRGHLTK